MSELRVMSFNVRYANPQDGPNYWEHRRDLALQRIRAFLPDLLGLQECQSQIHKPFLTAGLPEYTFQGVERLGPGGAGTEISAILFRTEAFDLLAQRHFWLSQTPDVPGTLAWGSALPRTVECAHLRHRASGRELYFFNTHLDYIPSAALGGAGLLRAEIESLPAGSRVILTGDFNADKTSETYRTLLGQGTNPPLRDSLREAGCPPEMEGSFHGFGAEASPQAIDWILISSGFKVHSAGVDRTVQAPRYPSDHYPLWAVLAVE